MMFHLALPEDWADAQTSGRYAMSTRGVTLAEQGFIHASKNGEQVRRVRSLVFSDVEDILLLHIDEHRLTDAGLVVRMEPGDPSDPNSELYPHLYGGPLPVSAVVAVSAW
uniref:DUF952 domain-containing protein n=1 Tax=Tessaracoccus timonensis TaxID=2161816 RepID=UPI000D54F326|nr:DUF952 domain-containing protein [Tessaracoccus timonensis]